MFLNFLNLFLKNMKEEKKRRKKKKRKTLPLPTADCQTKKAKAQPAFLRESKEKSFL